MTFRSVLEFGIARKKWKTSRNVVDRKRQPSKLHGNSRRKQSTFPKNALKLQIPEKDQEIPRKISDRISRKQREILGNQKYLEKFYTEELIQNAQKFLKRFCIEKNCLKSPESCMAFLVSLLLDIRKGLRLN